MNKVVAAIILTFLASDAIATVCFETPNPCKDAPSCEQISDFVFDAEFQGVNEEQYVNGGYAGKNSTIGTRKKALFKVENWLKGKPLHDPTLINDYVIDESLCIGVKPIAPEFEQGQKYRVYGYYHGSESYNKIWNSTEYPSPRMDNRYYLKFEELK